MYYALILLCQEWRNKDVQSIVVGKGIIDVQGTIHYAISSSGIKFVEGIFERLVVDPSCDLTWVSHDASLDQPLPLGSLIGGIITATNTPLYVVWIHVGGYFNSGYFNPINNRAWVEYYGVQSSNQFEVMVVLHVPR